MRKLEILVDGNPTPLRFTFVLKVSMPIELILIVFLILSLVGTDSFVSQTRAAMLLSFTVCSLK